MKPTIKNNETGVFAFGGLEELTMLFLTIAILFKTKVK